jgi:protein-S-isoprenylcysteine O-methyltransferase Ste14
MGHSSSRAFGWRALIGVVLLVPALLAAALSRPLVVEGSIADLILEVIAWPMFIGGMIIRFWATLYIGGRKGSLVICEGPYSLCRHPLYVGTFLISLSAAVMLGSPTVFVAVVLLGVAYARVVIPAEEQHLIELLGDDYRAYCRNIPRLLPIIKRPISPDWIEVRVGSLWVEFRRSLRWLMIPLACELLSIMRAESYWPHFLNLP